MDLKKSNPALECSLQRFEIKDCVLALDVSFLHPISVNLEKYATLRLVCKVSGLSCTTKSSKHGVLYMKKDIQLLVVGWMDGLKISRVSLLWPVLTILCKYGFRSDIFECRMHLWRGWEKTSSIRQICLSWTFSTNLNLECGKHYFPI